MDEWHYKRGETEFGPIQSAQLRALKERGALKSETLVRRGTAGVWLPLGAADLTMMEPPQAPAEPTESQASTTPGYASVYAPPKAATLTRRTLTLPKVLWVSAGLLMLVLVPLIVLRLAEVVLIATHQSDPEQAPGPLMAAAGLMGGIYKMAGSTLDWISFPLFLTLMAWQGCAFASLRSLYGDSMMTHGPASGLWWITPLANLLMPFLCLRELRHLSRRQRLVQQMGVPFGAALWTLETSLVVSMLLNWVMNRREKAIEGISRNLHMDSVTMMLSELASLSGAVFAVTMLGIVIGNLRQQRRLYEQWKH